MGVIDRCLITFIQAEINIMDDSMRGHDALPREIKAVIFDFDGVFTDNTVIVNENGQESVICNRSDGHGISALKKKIPSLLVLSTEKNPVVAMRCKKLGIPCIQGVDDKEAVLMDWLKNRNIDPEDIIFMGNDVNDTGCLELAGCSVVVADAHEDVKKIAAIILHNPGGHGAVRELCDMILSREDPASGN